MKSYLLRFGLILALMVVIVIAYHVIDGLIFWDWDVGLWWDNEVHRIFDYFRYVR